MTKWVPLCLAMVGSVGFLSEGLAQSTKTHAQSFLEIAAEGQQIEISLGQLAAQRAVNERVREFGQEMVDDHKKSSQQIEQLALKDGLRLAPGLSEEHKDKVNELSHLSGYAFDRAYLNYILEDHEATVEEFRRRMKTIRDEDIKQWITSSLPTLQTHRERALQVKYSLQTNP